MKRIFRFLARIFGSWAKYFDAKAAPQLKKQDPKKLRLRVLLSRSDLADDEQKELADLVAQFEGDVIYLDSPVHASAKEDL